MRMVSSFLVPLLGVIILAPSYIPATHAQAAYPSRPVRIIVPFPPGQAADIFARVVAERLTASWTHQVIVENRSGGGGVPGVMAGKTAKPDGYTWLIGTSGTFGINPAIYGKLPYAPLVDFAPATNIFKVPLVLVVHPSVPARSVKELVSLAAREGGNLGYASAGPGTAQHMTGELFKHRVGASMMHVPYKGSAPAMIDVIGGHVPVMFDSVTAAMPHIKAKKVRALAVTSLARSPAFPDLPTVAESGYPGFSGVGWSGIVLPTGSPAAIVERVSADAQKVLADPNVSNRILELGATPDPLTPQKFSAFIRDEMARWAEVAKIANVRLDQ